MRIDVLSLFPEMFDVLNHSILGRIQEKGLLTIHRHNIRDFASNKHASVDDSPYGGGAGMVMMCQPALDAMAKVKAANPGPMIYLGPQGQPFNQAKAQELSRLDGFSLLCGHYEGMDERILEEVDEIISLGDFVLTGGEMAALPLMDAVARLLPGALGSDDSVLEESFSQGLLEYPQYTKPADFRGKQVPEVLLSGHHEKIRQWRRAMSILRTYRLRKDLFDEVQLTKADWKALEASGMAEDLPLVNPWKKRIRKS